MQSAYSAAPADKTALCNNIHIYSLNIVPINVAATIIFIIALICFLCEWRTDESYQMSHDTFPYFPLLLGQIYFLIFFSGQTPKVKTACSSLIGLVYLLNGISTFMGYLIPKESLLKNNSSIISPTDGTETELITFQRYWSEIKHNRATRVWTHLVQGHSPAL